MRLPDLPISARFAFGATDEVKHPNAALTMRLQRAPLVLLLCLAAPAAAAESSTFRVTATIEKRQVSEDGRYALAGQALRKQETPSADGRYVLKATAATCNATTDSVFRDGFEAP